MKASVKLNTAMYAKKGKVIFTAPRHKERSTFCCRPMGAPGATYSRMPGARRACVLVICPPSVFLGSMVLTVPALSPPHSPLPPHMSPSTSIQFPWSTSFSALRSRMQARFRCNIRTSATRFLFQNTKKRMN